MTPENEIGRVVAVDTANVTVELNRDLKALTRSTYEGADRGRADQFICDYPSWFASDRCDGDTRGDVRGSGTRYRQNDG